MRWITWSCRIRRATSSASPNHRFSRYRLTFDLTELPDGRMRVSARSYGEFPGLPGLIYRTLVIGSRAHVLAVRHMLRGIRRQSLSPA